MTEPLRTYTEREMQNMTLRQRAKHSQQWHCKRSVTETFVCQYRDLCNHKTFQDMKCHSWPLILLKLLPYFFISKPHNVLSCLTFYQHCH